MTRTKKLLLILLVIPNLVMAGDNPFRDGYHQDTNPFREGYVQDKSIFEETLN